MAVNNNPFANFVIPNVDDVRRICVIGSGPLGILTTYHWARHYPLKRFDIIDLDDTQIIHYEQAVHALQNPNAGAVNLPFHEPDFLQLFTHVHTGAANLGYGTMNLHGQIIQAAHIIIIALDLKMLERKKRIGALADIDLSEWEKATRLIRLFLNGDRKMIIDFSPFPPIEGNTLRDQFRNIDPLPILLSNPQFFSLGTAIEELTHPPRFVLAIHTDTDDDYLNFVRDLFAVNAVETIILGHNFTGADFVRLATSCFFGIMSVYTNMLATLSDKLKTNADDVIRGVGADPRIGDGLMQPSVAVGGLSSLRDLNVLQFIAHHYNLDEHTRFIRSAVSANQERLKDQLQTMENRLIAFEGKILAIFGFASKAGISDISNSPSVSLCRELYKRGCNLRIFDPLVPHNVIRGVFRNEGRVEIMGKTHNAMMDTCDGCHALCFFTESPDFLTIDFDLAFLLMDQQSPSLFIFDFALIGFNTVNAITDLFVMGLPRHGDELD